MVKLLKPPSLINFIITSPNDVETEPFFKAIGRLRAMYPKKSSGWFEEVKNLMYSVIITEVKNNHMTFKVLKQVKETTRASYRKVTFKGGYRHCSCFYGSYGYVREHTGCRHIGTCLLLKFYLQELGWL